MIAQLVFVASALVVAMGGSAPDRYPAGLNPSLCPNYPHCDNALLAAHGQQNAGAAAYHAPASAFAFPGTYTGYTGHFPGAYSGHTAGTYAALGYPAGVNPATCPNYPYCTNFGSSAYHVAPLPGFAHRQYPDGVNPSTCPNYPFCH